MIAEERIVKKKTSKMRQGVSARLETASTSRTRTRCCAGSAVPLQISPEQSPRPVMKREAPAQKAGTGFSDDARDYLLKRFDKINNAQRFHALFTARPRFYESHDASEPPPLPYRPPQTPQKARSAANRPPVHSYSALPERLQRLSVPPGKCCGYLAVRSGCRDTTSKLHRNIGFTSSRPCRRSQRKTRKTIRAERSSFASTFPLP
jgi:hypothetical protein